MNASKNDYARLTFEFYPIRAKRTVGIATDCLSLPCLITPPPKNLDPHSTPRSKTTGFVNLSPMEPVLKEQ
jgi:hypothetical protein